MKAILLTLYYLHQMPPEEQKKTIESLCRLVQLEELVLEDSFQSDSEILTQHLPNTTITFESVGYDIP